MPAPVLAPICWAVWIAGVAVGWAAMLIWTARQRKLFREMASAELIYVRQYEAAQNSIYAGGDAPRIIGPGRVEILYYPDTDAEATD